MIKDEPNTKGIETVICNLCGADDTVLHFEAPVHHYRAGIYHFDRWPVVRCRQCDLIYVNPRVDDEARAAFYAFQTPGDAQFVRDWFIENADLQRPVWRRYLNAIRLFQPAGSLLDVGCGAGTFLVEARHAGFHVEGQEVADYFVTYCRDEQKLTIHDGFLDDLELEPIQYDVVTAFDVIEHHPNPKLLIQQMHALLKENGVIALSTHDIGNWYARRLGVAWRYIRPIGHITYFTRQTLSAMLNECGFELLKEGGIHTIDDSRLKEWRHRVVQFFRVILLRAVILKLYKPIAGRIPALSNWRLKLGGGEWTHEKLLMRAGQQIVMDDDMVLIARKRPVGRRNA